MRILKHNIRNR